MLPWPQQSQSHLFLSMHLILVHCSLILRNLFNTFFKVSFVSSFSKIFHRQKDDKRLKSDDYGFHFILIIIANVFQSFKCFRFFNHRIRHCQKYWFTCLETLPNTFKTSYNTNNSERIFYLAKIFLGSPNFQVVWIIVTELEWVRKGTPDPYCHITTMLTWQDG